MRSPQRVVVQGAVSVISQSNVIAACLFIAFIVFITMRGKLPQYLACLFGTNTGQAGGNSGQTGAPQADAAPTVGEAVQDPIGAAAGGLRRALGIENGLLGNLGRAVGLR